MENASTGVTCEDLFSSLLFLTHNVTDTQHSRGKAVICSCAFYICIGVAFIDLFQLAQLKHNKTLSAKTLWRL